MKIKHLSLFMLLGGLIFSCSEKKTEENDNTTTEETPSNTVNVSELMIEYNALKDSANHHWGILDSINDEMVITLNRLLDEVSYNAKHDASKLKEHREKIQALKEAKLKQVQLADKDMIDMYDNQVTATANDVIAYAENTPDMLTNYPLTQSLIDEINELNNMSIATKRSDYDDQAYYFNKFVKKHMNELKGTGVPLDLIPTFSEIITEELEDESKDIWAEDSLENKEAEPIELEM